MREEQCKRSRKDDEDHERREKKSSYNPSIATQKWDSKPDTKNLARWALTTVYYSYYSCYSCYSCYFCYSYYSSYYSYYSYYSYSDSYSYSYS